MNFRNRVTRPALVGLAAFAATAATSAVFRLQTVTVSSYSIAYKGGSSGTVVFNQAAPMIAPVALRSSSPEVAIVPNAIPVNAGSDRAVFPIKAGSAGCAVITGSFGGTSRDVYLVVHPAATSAPFTLTVPDQILPVGSHPNAKVSAGMFGSGNVSLSSSAPNVVSVPSTANMQRGTASFTMSTQRPGCAIISATMQSRSGASTVSKTVQVVDIGG